MTLDPKKLPPWMRKDKPNKPEAPAKPSMPPPADDGQSDVDLPPWLRDDFVPESKVKRIAPVHPEQTDSGDPPWLADIPEAEEPKSYKIGGAEISAEYLAGGDELADTVDSEMTFDAWMAEQEESKRVKDIEEEIPDLLTDLGAFESSPADAPDSKGTGQLPDWFLGLESLDTSDAPDWFVNEEIPDAQSKPQTDIPPWISDMVLEDEDTPEDEAPEDDFGSLLQSIGDAAYEDDAPADDWSVERDAVDDETVISDDFFAQLTAVEPDRPPPRASTPPPAADEDEVPSFEDLFAGLGEPDAQQDTDWQPPDDNAPIDDFFAQLSDAPPQLQPTLEDTEAVVEDFFAEIGDAPPQPSSRSWETSLPSETLPDVDDFDDFTDDELDARGTVEIPQIELDAFFDNVAAERSPSMDSIAEPDLEWFVSSEPEMDDAEDDGEIEEEPPPLPEADREDTMGWLSELNNIVTAVTRPNAPPPEETVVYDTGRLSDFEIERAASEARADVDEFEWPEPPAAPEPEPEPMYLEPEPDPSDWLDAITPDDLELLDDPPAEASSPPPPRRSLLSERLRKSEQPRPRAVDVEDQIFQLPSGDAEQDALLPDHELQSGWLRDDLFTPEEDGDDSAVDALPSWQSQQAEIEPAAGDDFAVDDLSSWDSQRAGFAVEADISDEFIPPELPSWADQQETFEATLEEVSAGDDLSAGASQRADFEPEADDDAFMAPELPSWATPKDDAELGADDDGDVDELSAWANQQAEIEPTDFEPEAAVTYHQDAVEDEDEDEIDFFDLLESNADANVLLRTGQLRHLEEAAAPPESTGEPSAALPEPDLDDLTGAAASGDSEMADDDFYRSFGLIDDSEDDSDRQQGGVSDDHFYASFNTGGMDDRDNDDDDDDFFASMGFDNDDMFGEQGEQPEESLDDDFFASLGLDAADSSAQPAADTPLPNWVNQQGESESQDDDFYNSLGVDDDDVEAAQRMYGSDEELLAALGMSSDDLEIPSARTPADMTPRDPTDDPAFNNLLGMLDAAETNPMYTSDEELLMALGLNDDTESSAADEMPDWTRQSGEQPDEQPDEQPEDDALDFDSVLGMVEADDTAVADVPDWASQQDEPEDEALDIGNMFDGFEEAEAAQSTYGSDEELLAALGLDSEDDEESAVAEMPDWANQPGEPEDEALDIGNMFDGFKEAEVAQPAYGSDEELLAALGLDSEDANEESAAAEMPDWERQQAEIDDFDALFGEMDIEEDAAQPMDVADEELPPEPDITIEVKRSRPATDQLPEWARLHYTPEDDEDLFGAHSITSSASAEPADDEMPEWAEQPAEAEADDLDFGSMFDDAEAEESAPAASGDDLFAQWATQSDDDELPLDDDLFAEMGVTSAQEALSAAPEDADLDWDNIYDQATAQTSDYFASTDEDDDAADTGAAPEKEDLFAQWATEAQMPPTDDFYSALDMIDMDQADEEADPLAWAQADVEAPPEEDFFSALGMIDENKPPVEPNAPGFSDIDSYLASLPTRQEDAPEPVAGFEHPVDLDLDAILSGSVFDEAPLNPNKSPFELEPGMTEDWLAELHANVEEVSASAIVRQKEDRPVDELPSRLQRLRRLSEQVPDETPPESALTEALPGVPNSLAPAPFAAGTPGLTQGVLLSPEQQAKANLLKSLIPTDDAPKSFRMSAIEATYDSPFMTDLEDTPETILQPVKGDKPDKKRARRPRRQRQRIRIDRLLIAALLAAAMIVPFFVGGFRIGSLPPDRFSAGSPAQLVFDQLDAVQPGALVLVGVEYGPASAAELDGMTDALVRHILMRAAYPVIISGNPLGLLRSANLIESINDDADFLARIGATEPLQANDDYYIVRYLPGGVIGLRAFSQDTGNLILSDIRGQASKLVVRSLEEFALVVVITDRAEDMRTYAEQVAPLTDAPLVSAVSYGAAPLAQPYANALGGGLLVGLGDAYTYANTLGLAAARDMAERIRIIPTNTPTPTFAVTATPLPSTIEPTVTTPPPTPTWTPEPLMATVISRQAVNMRSGPGTDNSVLAGVASGTTVLVLGFNDDGSWVNVQIEDGRNGWISAALLEIHEDARASKLNHVPPRRQQIDEDKDPTSTPLPPTVTPVLNVTEDATVEITGEVTAVVEATATRIPPTATTRPTRTPSPTPTVEPTSEATAEVTAEVTPEAAAPSGSETGYRDERWYAMNMGIIASALIITVGAVVNLGRGLLRRGRRR